MIALHRLVAQKINKKILHFEHRLTIPNTTISLNYTCNQRNNNSTVIKPNIL